MPVRFEVAGAALRDAVEARFGAWRHLTRRPDLVDPPADPQPTIRLEWDPRRADGERDGAGGDLRIRTGAGDWLGLRGRTVAGAATTVGRRARLRVAPPATRPPRAVGAALDTVTLFLITRLDRAPVHAAMIADGERGLVLAGPSGAGKSTLAYAASRAGMRVLTDDAVYVQLGPRPRAWGLGRPLHLPLATAARFPELAGRETVPRPGGTSKVPVPLQPPADGLDEPPVLERVGLCVLDPNGVGPAFERISVDTAVETLSTRLAPGFDAFHATIPDRIRALAERGAWRVRVGPRPEEALPEIRSLLAALEA